MKIFQKSATAIFCTFMILMVIVTATAYSRRSGHTGLDMAKIQQLRSRPQAPSHEIAEGKP